jgi:hypothetical protein
MEHFHHDTYTLKGETRLANESATFSLGADGEVARLRLFDQDFSRE